MSEFPMTDRLSLAERTALLAGYTVDPGVAVSLFVKGLTNHSILPDRTVLRPTEKGWARRNQLQEEINEQD